MFARYLPLFLALVVLPLQAAPDIQHWITEKGARVYFVETHELPMLDVRMIFDAGGSRDGKHPGLAALTVGLLDEGAEGFDADQISSAFESRGAIYSSGAGYDSASVSLRSLVERDKLLPALKNLKRVISRPDFPRVAIERQRKRTLLGIQKKQQSPQSLAGDAFYAALYGKHPYASPVEGTEASVQAIKRKDIVNFYRKYYVTQNATIAIVGDLSREQAEVIAEELVADLKPGKQAPPLPQVAPLTKAKMITLSHPSSQTHILLGQPGLKRGDPDYFALYVGNHVLGGGGMVSRLFEEVREKRGLSYSVYSYFSPMREAGPFMAGLQTKTEQAPEALQVLIDNLRQFIEHGPTAEELRASKKNITGGFPLRLNSNAKILDYVAMIGFYGLPLDYLETFNSKVEAVTIEQIKDAFKRRIDPDKLVTVMVGQVSDQQNKAGP